ncbi:hypothetical protein DWZ46_00565 [Faecalibacterium prausnitzii]|uniref:Uncharacterized protein n=1 Tax=Faecalibacterium prausnitzii TaxID=853 RepID=A0A3E2UBX8_9FIRM|nr:hypothetical protein DWZ46_00565 [Faecalibacterium prausnitzii]
MLPSSASATATTAASGGNREKLLGPRPAGYEARSRAEIDAGSRNPEKLAVRCRFGRAVFCLTEVSQRTGEHDCAYPAVETPSSPS